MSPVPAVTDDIKQPLPCAQNGTLHHYSKRINLNPFHNLTLPIKNNWSKVSPVLEKYNNLIRTMAILLGGIGIVVLLDQH
jgi:hypothetical protein